MNPVFEIGGLRLVVLSSVWQPRNIPFNFRPFLRGECGTEDEGAALRVVHPAVYPCLPASEPLSTSFNDLGQTSLYDGGGSWTVALVPVDGEYPRLMTMNKDMTSAELSLRTDDPFYSFVIDSMARIYFSQYAVMRGGLMLHASVVTLGDDAFMFMGRSGTGKSTHSRLWISGFDGCELLNDDCPLVMPDGNGGFTAWGTPWSGKTRCYRDSSCRLKGIVRLCQAPRNRFIRLDGIEAFVAFIPGMSVISTDKELYSTATGTALGLLDYINFGILECRPDLEAAILCRNSLQGGSAAS